ncbi:hypothetical protein [Marinilactibacillus psychrotolerans]|uniref:Uncharacterized protein n=1 Tax=Marinilactibacillus psychrotolerans TaxID=191770 RepID=A0AAV3WVZ8_9LACT|nr:hypothetical protein [Marinilactibacillus psychrotolerans]GEQ36828.1 hypothetical protein M132T_23360 [Marinilactibacillus psychrotolerans]SDD35130.1 hypothetical protein SAMN04488013_1272 [Marinilactibacillus psychrotolerans]
MEDDNEITDEDIWGLGESSLILMENEIEELLKKNTMCKVYVGNGKK